MARNDEVVLLGRDGSVVVIDLDGVRTCWEVVANAVLNGERVRRGCAKNEPPESDGVAKQDEFSVCVAPASGGRNRAVKTAVTEDDGGLPLFKSGDEAVQWLREEVFGETAVFSDELKVMRSELGLDEDTTDVAGSVQTVTEKVMG